MVRDEADTGEQPASQETASLVHRLAGPSTGKAGLALDQTEINRVIADASKGSKFYDNEKRKDKELTERISRILRRRDEVTSGVDLERVAAGVDRLLKDLEAQRDLSQTIVHVDMDAFYANVELMDNPSLAGKPFGVVGGGVLTTASYEARKYGVRSGMPAFIAKKLCPELVTVKLHFDRYIEMSRKIMDIFRRYDPTMSSAGIDEGYLNITPYCTSHQLDAETCVAQMREQVFQEVGLTVSAGIAPNKMLAKICSDKNKPNGQYALPFDGQEIIKFMSDMSIRKVPGIGRVHERVLDSVGIKTCHDIWVNRAMISLLDKELGLQFLLQAYLGIASNVVQPGRRETRKSMGCERTFSALGDTQKILAKLEEIATELEKDLKEGEWAGRTVTLKIKLDNFQVFTRAKSFDRWITKREDLLATGKELLKPLLPVKIRLIGLRVTKMKDLRDDTGNEGSIKRFFDGSTNSPVKKRLKSSAPADLQVEDIEAPAFVADHDEEEFAEAESDEEAVEADEPSKLSSKPRSSVVKERPSTPTPEPSRKPDSRATREKPPSKRMRSDGLVCPICNRIQHTDNDGLNAHIDFCLSKSEIMNAVKGT